MENVIKAFLGIIFTILCVFLGVMLISTSINSRKANAFLENTISKIEYSDYSASVINSLKEDAASNEYELDVSVFGDKPNQYGVAVLTYKTTLPIINYSNTKTLSADLN